MTFRIEVVTEPGRFEEICQAWRQLWERSGAHIFQSHDWITGWSTGIRDRRDVKLRVALAWDGDRLAAAMPCAVHRRAGLRVLTWAAQLFSDYCDGLIDPGYRRAGVLTLLWNELRRSGGFDLISLQQVRPDAQCRDFLDQLAQGGSGLQSADREERCMRIENCWPDGDAFFRSLNKKGRNNYTRGKRILAELGGEVRFRIIDATEPVGPVVDEILRLKEAWLRATNPTSPLLGADGFVLRAILDKAWQSGLAKIFLLECGDGIAAASINFVYANRMEAYLTSYDARFERASPGTILIVEYARWSFDRGLKYVDFLRGDEAFKFRMANAETVLSSFAGARTLMGHVAVSGHRWLTRRRQRQEMPDRSGKDELETVD
ncbi:MAG: GNAT family N-acetyltransferase [Rhodopila sp.]|nr:GNAT family N-acetyltransferase [Rhodopila sp.]